jgi:DNA-binding beta-propeller fold protein YncE
MTLVPTVTLSLPGFTNPTGNAVDAAGNVYVPNLGSHGTNSIAVFTAPVTSASTPAFFLNGLRFPGSLIFDAQGNLYASDNPQGSQSAIVRYNSNNLVSGAMPNVVDPTGLGTQNYGTAFAFDGLGNLYVADCGNAGSAGVRTYLTGTNPFTATLAPSSTFTDVPINSLGCVWGIAIH